MKIDRAILDNFVWSFSRLNSFYNCKYGWYKRYVENQYGENNCFGQFGSFSHSILEKYAKEQLDLFELSDYYTENFDKEITYEFPPNKYCDLRNNYFNDGKLFFDNFSGFESKVIAVEQEIRFDLDDGIQKYPFQGFIDLVLQDKNNDYIVLDYKSKKAFTNKSELKNYSHQPYLYSKYIYDTYGKYPKAIIFYMFRKQNIIKIPFDIKDYKNSFKWATETIHKIYDCDEWEPNINRFFCDYICNLRNGECEYK